jgi:HEPN domain-containing protein
MNLKDTIQWFQIADADYDSAKILNNNIRKYNDIICYHCSQAVEKYLKGYLVYNNSILQNTHNLPYINSLCIEKSKDFQEINNECRLLNNYTHQIRYPHEMEITSNDVSNVLKAVEKVRHFKPLLDLRTTLINEIHKEKKIDEYGKTVEPVDENTEHTCKKRNRKKTPGHEWDR